MLLRLLFGCLILGAAACATGRTDPQVFGAADALGPALTSGKDGTRLRIARPAHVAVLAEVWGHYSVVYGPRGVLEAGSHALDLSIVSAIGRWPCSGGAVAMNERDRAYQQSPGRIRRTTRRGDLGEVLYLESLAVPPPFRGPMPAITVASERPLDAARIETTLEQFDAPEDIDATERAALLAAALVRASGEAWTAAQVSVHTVWICR